MKVEIGDSNTKTKVESEPGNAKLLNSSELNPGKKERKALSGTHRFKKPYPNISEIEVLSLATLDLLNQYAYPSISGYGKLTISLTMKQSYGEEITFTTGSSIPE
uniref:Uncharacterized protein n=1 Tax=Ombrophytum subterraneum TaxID=50155 RepID=A0A6M8PP63_9MAGN|nr:hypothetical protein [Ombrophytum subterraneum]